MKGKQNPISLFVMMFKMGKTHIVAFLDAVYLLRE